MYRVGPRFRRHTLGRYPVLGLADARDRAKKDLNSLTDGHDPARQKGENRNAMTFGELAADYMERHAKKRKRSWREDQRILDVYVLPEFRKVAAKDIHRPEVRELLERIAETAPVQANRVLACVRKTYNWAISQDLIEHNPCHGITRPGDEHQRDRVLSEDEIKAIWQTLEAERLEMAALFRLRLLAAQRGGELATMQWADVDLKSAWWTIPSERAKNGLSHRVPLSPPAVRILQELSTARKEEKNEQKRLSPWVFPHRRNPISQSATYRRPRRGFAQTQALKTSALMTFDARPRPA